MAGAIIFFLSYFGIALGKIPGLAIDRVGIALLGAIAMVACGIIPPTQVATTIHLPTILLLYALMVISAQLRLGGFYTWTAARLGGMADRPRLFLLTIMAASAVLSALLANDIICFAFTPVLSSALIRARLNPLPFLIGLATASNIGSAATIIGNPQNMLISQVGGLDFLRFTLWCTPPSAAALIAAYFIILLLFRHKLQTREELSDITGNWPEFDRWQSLKGLVAVAVLILLFLTDIPREVSATTVAAILLCSRKMTTRSILGLVDWHLITLFCALFVIIAGVQHGGWLKLLFDALGRWGLDLTYLPLLSLASMALSNLVSNVPAAMLLLHVLDPGVESQWYTLALSSTFAGNLFLLGSIANLIVVEEASRCGITISLRSHASIGIPITLASLLILFLWLPLAGP